MSRQNKSVNCIKLRPVNIIGSEMYWCPICGCDYPKGHYHFDFKVQTTLELYQ